MGGTGKKLREWGKWEYGQIWHGIAGNCAACELAHKQLKKPVPCQRCPKYKLYPAGYGLMPENQLAVELYNLSSRDRRVGLEAVLIGTLSPADARAVIDIYEDRLPHAFARQRTFELMMVLDRVVTETRAKAEALQRKSMEKNRKIG